MAVQVHEVKQLNVCAVNDKGIKDTDGTWYNVSKYANVDDCPMPRTYDVVNVHLDKASFIRRIERIQTAPTSEPTAETTPPVAAVIVDDRRQQLIVRQNALAHAVVIITANRTDGSKIRLDDVLKCAEQIEAWILR